MEDGGHVLMVTTEHSAEHLHRQNCPIPAGPEVPPVFSHNCWRNSILCLTTKYLLTYLFLRGWVFCQHVCMCTPGASLWTTKEGSWFIRNWIYRRLWVTMWGLELKPRPAKPRFYLLSHLSSLPKYCTVLTVFKWSYNQPRDSKYFLKIYHEGAREMAQWLGAPTALKSSQFSSKHPHGSLQPSIVPGPGHPVPPWASGIDSVHVYTHRQSSPIKGK